MEKVEKENPRNNENIMKQFVRIKQEPGFLVLSDCNSCKGTPIEYGRKLLVDEDNEYLKEIKKRKERRG